MGLEHFLKNPESISFAVLFVSLFIWTMKTNDKREKRYQETISELTRALNSVEDIKKVVNDIHEKIRR